MRSMNDADLLSNSIKTSLICLLYWQFQHDKLKSFNCSDYKTDYEIYPIVFLLVSGKEVPSRGCEINSAAITAGPGKDDQKQRQLL